MSNDHLTAQASEKAKAWFVENAKAILNQYSDAKKKGIWIVTKTYAANQRAVALLRSKETKVIFGVNAELLTVGKIAPEVSWWKGSKEEVWKVAEAVRAERAFFMLPSKRRRANWLRDIERQK